MNLEGVGRVELYLTRAYDVCRINEEDLIKLQTKESNIGRALLPHEIQGLFALPLIKEAYQIPEHESSQSSHNQRLRGEFRTNGLIPKFEDFNLNELEKIHEWDHRVRVASNDLKVNLTFQGGRGSKRKISEEME